MATLRSSIRSTPLKTSLCILADLFCDPIIAYDIADHPALPCFRTYSLSFI